MLMIALRSSVFTILIAATTAAFADNFPAPIDTERDRETALITPAQAAASFSVPPGIRTTLFAAEPDVQNPIGMAWDGRGRLWIAENYTYAENAIRFDLNLRDRVVILEDTNGDGTSDRRTVFTDNVQMLTSVAVGHGGVWLMSPPQLLFIPDANGDDIPDGPARVVLDGFTVAQQNYHNFANGLKWGPDGWLYGRCGGSCPGEVGRPGTPAEQRTPLRGGIWRYHPQTQHFEVISTGTTNPWGHDWTALGECFFINTVNGHLWQAIPGAHYVRNGSLDPNPRVYRFIDQHADHWHFDTGKSWQQSRDGAANDLGGGHAHSGMTIYLGDQWPEEYRGRLMTINLHGRRVNQEHLEREGSGYVGRHRPDMLLTSDIWFRGIDLSYGPDGSIYVLDWCDIGECHENTGVHRNSGRVYRFSAGTEARAPESDIPQRTDLELAELHKSSNEWLVRQARLALSERHRAGQSLTDARSRLKEIFNGEKDPVLRFRCLATLYQLNAVSPEFLGEQLSASDESLRTWGIRLLTDHWPIDGPLGPVAMTAETKAKVAVEIERWLPTFVTMARTDNSGLVRLALASTLQRLPVSLRPELAKALVSRQEDANDHNLPLLVWFGLIPVGDADPAALVEVMKACTWPTTRQMIARRLAEAIETTPQSMAALLDVAAASNEDVRADILAGVSEAFRGWRKATAPANWEKVQPQLSASSNSRIQEQVRELSVLFGDGRALDEVRAIVLNDKADPVTRQAALRTLIDSKPADLQQVCENVLPNRHLGVIAATGLASINDPAIGDKLVGAYRRFQGTERPIIISTLASRPTFATSLLKGIAAGKIPRQDLTAFQARQIQSLGDPAVNKLLGEVWGELRESSEDKQRLQGKLRELLTEERLSQANLSLGRGLFAATCSKCHRLYGEGTTIGPDLTGSNRSNLDYLIENIVDPSAIVNKDFRMTILLLADGRVLNGVITSQSDRTVTLQTQTEQIVIEKDEIDEMKPTTLSPMPEGQLETMTPEQIVDLIAYLRHPNQVPLPEGTKAGE